jgi:DNA replication protein DnaC
MAQTDLLVLDDFGMKVLDGQQLLDFLELIEDRHGRKSTIIISQLPVADWYDVMNSNSTAADAILDRIVHTAHRFELNGDSLRKK